MSIPRAAAVAVALFAIGTASVAETPSAGAEGTKTVTIPADQTKQPKSQVAPPKGYRLSAMRAVAIAKKAPQIQSELRDHRDYTTHGLQRGTSQWQVSFFSQGKEIAQVIIDDQSAKVAEAWTGIQVPWTMARGYPGAFGRKANALYIWIPLLVLFLVPFIDWRRLWKIKHLDLIAVAALSIPFAFFTNAEIGWSSALTFPLLLYLLLRMCWSGFRGGGNPLQSWVGTNTLGIGLIFLVGFRLTLNLIDSNVIDVGYAGVIGADRISHGEALYGNFPSEIEHGDTYGPVTYLAYLPFELIWPWTGKWDSLPAAHAASISFDLAAVLLLFWLGRRQGGNKLGVALAYAWAACPFTLLAMNSNSNDSLVAALGVLALIAVAKPVRAGMAAALQGLAKVAPLALTPLLFSSPGLSWARAWRFAIGFLVAGTLLLGAAALGGDPTLIIERTIGYQWGREAPFSIWGYFGLPGFLRTAVAVGAVGLAVAVMFLPKRKQLVQVAALAAAVTLALQLAATYWFFLYIVWFLPFVLIALLVPKTPDLEADKAVDLAQESESERGKTDPYLV